jgi:high-affinity iron transporter
MPFFLIPVFWKAVFELIAAIMIFVMGLSMLKLDRGKYNFEVYFHIRITLHFIAKTKWRIKLQKAFEGKSEQHIYLK